MVEEPSKFGNPWSILPVKNAKYARDLTEVHLSDRDLDFLEKFLSKSKFKFWRSLLILWSDKISKSSSS